MNSSDIIWKYSNKNHSNGVTNKRVLLRITWFAILLWKAGNSADECSVKCIIIQLAITSSKLTIETLEQGVKYIQS